MRKDNETIELLAPAGSYDALRAVVSAGCDAVYIGGTRFGARAYADNPEEELLIRGIDHAHMRGVKVYLTVNTLLKNAELSELRDYLLPYYEAGLDAVIVQDFGVMTRISEWFPGLPIHASTQMTITDVAAFSVLPAAVTRVVPARELSLEEIRRMAGMTDRELEIFVHGALCYSYSGQCLLSSMIGGRSGNRGRCAQPCRKMYRYEEDDRSEKAGYLLSPKDQCLLPGLHELLDTGIDSLKIEGRMKRPEYAAGVTAVYRRWIDRYVEMGSEDYAAYLAGHEEEMRADVALLAELYNRGGFCGGYVFEHKGSVMMATDRPNHTGVKVGTASVKAGVRPTAAMNLTKEIGPEDILEFRTADQFVCGEITIPKDMTRFDAGKPVALRLDGYTGKTPRTVDIFRMKQETLLAEIRDTFLEKDKDVEVSGTFVAKPGEPIRLTVTDEESRACVTVTGTIPEPARMNATDASQVMAKLRRTGGSGYAWKHLSADIGDGLFLPVSGINEIRREALAAYEEAVLTTRRRVVPKAADEAPRGTEAAPKGEPACAVCVFTPEQTEAALRSPIVTDLIVDTEGWFDACLHIVRAERSFGAAHHIAVSLALPRVCKGRMREEMLATVGEWIREPWIAGLCVRTPDQLAEIPAWKAARPDLRIIADDTLYVMNDVSERWLRDHGVEHATVSQELRRSEISQETAERSWITVYGRSVLMTSEQCPHRTVFGCKGAAPNGRSGTLSDEEGNRMPVKSICRYCRSNLYNAHVTSLLPALPEVMQKNPYGFRLNFVTETRRETERILRAMQDAMWGEAPAELSADVTYTKGHWRRGVE